MVRIEDIHSLTEFQRNAKKHIDYINKTGNVEVITVNGDVKVVVMDKDEYNEMLQRLDYLKSCIKLDKACRDVEAGNFTPAEKVFKNLRKMK